MTAREMLPAIGSRALVRFESILVECVISDAKFSYGNARVLVSPIFTDARYQEVFDKTNNTYNNQWVDFGRLVFPVSSQCEQKGIERQ